MKVILNNNYKSIFSKFQGMLWGLSKYNDLFNFIMLVLPFTCYPLYMYGQIETKSKIPLLIEEAITKQFKRDFFSFRETCFPNKKDNQPYFIKFSPNSPENDDNIKMILSLYSVEELFGQKKDEGLCIIEKGEKNHFINLRTKDTFQIEMNDKYFPRSSKYLVKYQIISYVYPFKVELYYISGNFMLSDPGLWLGKLLGNDTEDNYDFRNSQEDAQYYLKSRLYTFNSTEPKWDSLDDFRIPYWSYFISKCNVTLDGPCEARVYRRGYDVSKQIDLVYYTSNPDRSEIVEKNNIAQNAGNIYQVTITMKILSTNYENYSPRIRLLSEEEKQQLIAKGKFYPFFHSE